MTIKHSQPFSARCIHTLRLFNIFGNLRVMLVAGVLLVPQLLAAQWNATVGAESDDLGEQDLAFLPNEMWIHAGDSITWTVTAAITAPQLDPLPFQLEQPHVPGSWAANVFSLIQNIIACQQNRHGKPNCHPCPIHSFGSC